MPIDCLNSCRRFNWRPVERCCSCVVAKTSPPIRLRLSTGPLSWSGTYGISGDLCLILKKIIYLIKNVLTLLMQNVQECTQCNLWGLENAYLWRKGAYQFNWSQNRGTSAESKQNSVSRIRQLVFGYLQYTSTYLKQIKHILTMFWKIYP